MAKDDNGVILARTEFDPALFEGLNAGKKMELLFKLSVQEYHRQAAEQGIKVPPLPPRDQWPVKKFRIGESSDT